VGTQARWHVAVSTVSGDDARSGGATLILAEPAVGSAHQVGEADAVQESDA
jgi:hypothetical protein